MPSPVTLVVHSPLFSAPPPVCPLGCPGRCERVAFVSAAATVVIAGGPIADIVLDAVPVRSFVSLLASRAISAEWSHYMAQCADEYDEWAASAA